MVESLVTGIVSGMVAGVTAPLILAWASSSKWWRKRENRWDSRRSTGFTIGRTARHDDGAVSSGLRTGARADE